jgi:hypothetical protein
MTQCRCADVNRAWRHGHGHRESCCEIPKGLEPGGREPCIGEIAVVCE